MRIPESNSSPPRLSHFRVSGLFDEFDHNIPINLTERITVIIGPNGRGKTVCLRLINAFFRRQWSLYRSTIFTSLEYAFSNGNTVKVLKTPSETASEAAPASLGIRFTIYSTSNGEGTTWEPHTTELQRSRLQQLERYLPFLFARCRGSVGA